jgi:hypothetical protein
MELDADVVRRCLKSVSGLSTSSATELVTALGRLPLLSISCALRCASDGDAEKATPGM